MEVNVKPGFNCVNGYFDYIFHYCNEYYYYI